jgi:hypothetical protein
MNYEERIIALDKRLDAVLEMHTKILKLKELEWRISVYPERTAEYSKKKIEVNLELGKLSEKVL